MQERMHMHMETTLHLLQQAPCHGVAARSCPLLARACAREPELGRPAAGGCLAPSGFDTGGSCAPCEASTEQRALRLHDHASNEERGEARQDTGMQGQS